MALRKNICVLLALAMVTLFSGIQVTSAEEAVTAELTPTGTGVYELQICGIGDSTFLSAQFRLDGSVSEASDMMMTKSGNLYCFFTLNPPEGDTITLATVTGTAAAIYETNAEVNLMAGNGVIQFYEPGAAYDLIISNPTISEPTPTPTIAPVATALPTVTPTEIPTSESIEPANTETPVVTESDIAENIILNISQTASDTYNLTLKGVKGVINRFLTADITFATDAMNIYPADDITLIKSNKNTFSFFSFAGLIGEEITLATVKTDDTINITDVEVQATSAKNNIVTTFALDENLTVNITEIEDNEIITETVSDSLTENTSENDETSDNAADDDSPDSDTDENTEADAETGTEPDYMLSWITYQSSWLDDGTYCNTDLKVQNNTETDMNGTVTLAVYDNNGVLCGVKQQTMTFLAGATDTVKLAISGMKVSLENMVVRAFLWEENTMVPLCDAITM